jgi:two-component system, chemotaxis family, sensor kinase CheA
MNLGTGFMQQLLATFAGEAREHVETISRDLLELEAQPAGAPGDERLTRIFRAAHNLKGAARAVSLDGVSTLAHNLETLFGGMQNGAVLPNAAHFDVCYRALDAVTALVAAAVAGDPPMVDVAALSLLLQAAARNETAAAPPLPDPSLAPPHAQVLPPAATPMEVTAAPMASPETFVRISTAKLDALLAETGELMAARLEAEQRLTEAQSLLEEIISWEAGWRKGRRRLFRQGDEVKRFLEAGQVRLRAARIGLDRLCLRLAADHRTLAQSVADMGEQVRRSRMLPIATTFEAFPRMVRDLAHEQRKEVILQIRGGDVEVDRSVIEQVKDPLTHLLRNCLDHGLELPAARKAAGKSATGTIELSAALRGDSIIITVADDGAGISLDETRAAAIARGMVTAAAAAAMTDRELLWLIFRPGLSTNLTVTDLSGRGVGLDVVREHVERMRGSVDVSTEPGRGTTFSLTLPLNVAASLCLLARVEDRLLAVPVSNVERILRITPSEIGRAAGRQVITVEGRPVLLSQLAGVLGTPGSWQVSGDEWCKQGDSEVRRRNLPVFILRSAEAQAGFLVDELLDAQEFLVKRLPAPLRHLRYAEGVAIRAGGDVVAILNAGQLVRSASAVREGEPAIVPQAASPALPPAILVADDSITTRTLVKNILEVAGYRVRLARDGIEAWDLLQREGCVPGGTFSMLVSDVRMPRLDGFELIARVRADARMGQLPIALVTAQDSAADRARGVQAGADAYVVKSAFDQDDLLATIRRLI